MNVTDFLKGLTSEQRHILFWYVSVPGVKSITALRELVGIDRGSVQDGNRYVDELCRGLSAYLKVCRDDGNGLARKTYALTRSLSVLDLRALGREAEMMGWWPEFPAVRRLCDASWVRAMLVEDKRWYDGQANKVYAVVQGMRQLLVGNGVLPSVVKGEEAALSLIRHYTNVLATTENILDVADQENMPTGFSVRLLELAFAEGRDIRCALPIVVENCVRHPRGVKADEVLEICALCVWTGQRTQIEQLHNMDWVDGGIISFLDGCLRLFDAGEVTKLIAAVRRLSDPTGDYKSYQHRIAWRLLTTAAAIRGKVGQKELAKIAEAGTGGCFWGGRNYSYPPAGNASFVMSCVCNAFSKISSRRYRPYAYSEDWRYDLLDGRVMREGQLAHAAGFYILHIYDQLQNFRLSETAVRPLIRAFETGARLCDAGYPTLAGVVAVSTTGLVDAMQTRQLAQKVDASSGIWLFPFQSPESNWRQTLDELTNALPKKGWRERKEASPSVVSSGYLVWGICLCPLAIAGRTDERTYRLENLVTGYCEGERRLIEAIETRVAASAKYAACRTADDNAIICELPYFRDSQKAADRRRFMELLLRVPHIAVARIARRYVYGPKDVDFDRIRLNRGDFTVRIETQDDGSLALSVPEWIVGFDGEYCIRNEGDGTYAYYEFTNAQKRLLEIFSRRGTNGLMLMPAEAESALRGWIENVAHVAKVVGAKGESVLARSQDLRRITADATPVVRLSFEGERLDVAVGTVSYEGADFGPPTDTAGESLARMDGEPVLLVRCAETQLPVFQEILTVLSHDDVESVAAFHWRVMTLAESLSVLMALKAMGDRIRIEWPSGSKVNVSELDDAAVDFSDFKTERNWFAVRGSFKLDSGRMMNIIAMLKVLDSSSNGFVRLSDGDYLKLSKSLQRRLVALKAAGVIHKDALEVTPAAVPMLAKAFDDETGGLPKALKESASRMATVFARTMPVPKNLKAKLRPYQKDGYAWLARHAECGFGSCLADDMGLGKTLQVIALLLSRSADGPSLVVAPASVCGNWKSELARFAPSLRVFMGWEFDHDEKNPFKWLKKSDVVVVSYGLIVSRGKAFASRTWNGIVLDEAQAIKNETSKRAHVVKGLVGAFRVAATGTPVENKLTELWSLFDFLNPGLLGPGTTFAQRLTFPDGTATEGLKNLVAPFVLRRLKANVLTDLPPKTEITLPIELGKDERTAYEACREYALASLKGNEENRISILAELTRLRRFCCHPSLVLPNFKDSAKLEALSKLLSDLKSAGHRALVFSQFTDYLAIVRRLLDEKGWSCCYLDGTTPIAERARAVAAFQAGEGDFFLISLKAGGTGLNLTSASYVVLLDPWWNPAVENQAADRVHRIGQRNPVTVYRLIAAKTVEERVLELHQEKLKIAEDVLDGTSKSKLTPEMLMRLFA